MVKEAVCSCIFLLYLQNRLVKYIKRIFLYMNIIQIKTRKKNSTDELYSVHCVHIPSIFTSCKTCSFTFFIHRLPSVHIGYRRFISVHIGSHWFTSVHVDSHWFTSVHIGSHWFTSVHVDSHRFTSVYVVSRRFTSIHIIVHIGLHGFSLVHIG